MTTYTLEEFQKLSPEKRADVAMNVAMKIDRVKHPKRFVKHRAKVNLSMEQVQALLGAAYEGDHPEDWFILYLTSEGDDGKGPGLRIGEVIGDHRHGADLPGLQVDDLRDDGIWVRGKMGHKELMPLDTDIVDRLRYVCVGKRASGMIFNRYEGLVEAPNVFQKRIKQYARKAGLIEWKLVTPHRLRAAMAQYHTWVLGQSPKQVQKAMRHKQITTQETYVGEASEEQMRQIFSGTKEGVRLNYPEEKP